MKILSKKIVLAGNPSVGKTSLIRRFVLNSFDDKYIATIGVKVSKKTISIFSDDNIKLNMMIFDILGQHDFKNMRRMAFEGTDGALIVCDLTRPETIEAIGNFWIPEIKKITGSIPIVVIGNKLDLVSKNKDEIKEIQAVSNILQIPMKLCSAKTGEGVEDSFTAIARELVSRHFEKKELTKEVSEIEDLRMAADAVMSHFCEAQENRNDAMQICLSIFEDAGFNIEKPSKKSLLKAIDLMADAEAEKMDDESVLENKNERLLILNQLDHSS